MKYYVSTAILFFSLLINLIQWEACEKQNNQLENMTTSVVENPAMKLGAFSVSLSVKDLAVSKRFYENLGFEVLAGSFDVNYFIMKNEETVIGLFHGMFEGNILTFNPGWDSSAQLLDEYTDIRSIHKHLVAKEVKINDGMDMKEAGPSSLSVTDPDGNLILIDQHR